MKKIKNLFVILLSACLVNTWPVYAEEQEYVSEEEREFYEYFNLNKMMLKNIHKIYLKKLKKLPLYQIKWIMDLQEVFQEHGVGEMVLFVFLIHILHF